MKTFREQLGFWKNELYLRNYSRVLNEFKNCVFEKRWSLSDEVYAGCYCLVALNAETHKILKQNSKDAEFAPVIFESIKVFCASVEKSWDHVTVDFPASVFYIFKYFLDRKFINESLFVARQALEYQNKCSVSADSKNQPNVVYTMLTYLSIAAEKFDCTNDVGNQYDLLVFLCTNAKFAIKRSKLPVLLKLVSSFLLKCARSSNDNYIENCSNLLCTLARSACADSETAESTFMEIIRVLVYDICELSISKKRKNLLSECINTFEELSETSSTTVNFCRNVYRLSVCLPDDGCLSDIVVRANYELQTLLSSKSRSLNNAVYFSTVVIIKMRDWYSAECPFKRNCVIHLSELLITLAEQTLKIDLNEFCPKEDLPRRDICASAYLCTFLLYFVETITDLNIGSTEVSTFILRSAELCRECILNTQRLERKKRQQMCYLIGVSFVNIYRRFMEHKLYEKYIELCSLVCPAFMTLDAEDLMASNFQLCLKKLVANLCTSYRTIGSYIEALATSLAWSVIIPNHAVALMEIYGNLKYKLFASNEQPEHPFHELTCVDLLKHEKNPWQHEKLDQVNLFDLLRLELEQYQIFNVCSVTLMQNFIEVIRNMKPTLYQKALLYMIIGEILTNTDSSESLNFLKRFLKSVNALVNLLTKHANSPAHVEVTTIYALLGDLLYVKFRIELLIHRSENESEVKSLSSFKKPASAEPGMEPNFKDEGNITLTNYVCLSMERKLIKLLDSAVENWSKGFQNKSTLNLSHVKDTALIYRLYFDIIREVNAWKLLYLAATTANDYVVAVYAYSNLLITPWAEDATWKENVENQLLSQVPENSRLFHQLCYLHRRFIDGFNMNDEKTLLSMSKDELKKHNLWANYCFLLARCIRRNFIKFPKSPQLMAYLAYSVLMYRAKSKKWNSLGECCELQCLLFDVVLFIVSANVHEYRIAEAKSYLKDPINLIQKLSLPLRTCQYLNVTIRIDTLTCTLEDCYLKLQDVCDILDVKHDTKAMLCEATKPSLALSPIMDTDLRADGSGRRFEFPTFTHIAPRWKFQMPDFMKHVNECKCDSCSSVEYCRLLCEVTALFGTYYRLADRADEAIDFFEGFICLYDIIQKRLSPLSQPLIGQFLAIKAFAMYEYANFWAMKGDFDKASTFNAIATKCSKDCDSPSRDDCTEQLWAILAARCAEAERNVAVNENLKAASKSVKIQMPRVSTFLKLMPPVKTPASRVVSRTPRLFVDDDDDSNNDNVEKEPVSSCPITPYPRQSRRILFDQFASPPTVSMGRRREKKKKQFSTPPDIVMQTPSVIEKRSRRLGDRKKIRATENTPPKREPASLLDNSTLKSEPRNRRTRADKENITSRK